MRIATADIKRRFDEVNKTHISLWDKENPEPISPTMRVMVEELKKGKIEVNEGLMAKAMETKEKWDREYVFEIVAPVSWRKYERAQEVHEAAKKEFLIQLSEAKNTYLDRVLFDHENGFVLLTDFKRWKPTK